jgi:hypothetical protein
MGLISEKFASVFSTTLRRLKLSAYEVAKPREEEESLAEAPNISYCILLAT